MVYWFPFYYTFKFVFLLWLAMPTFRYVQPHQARASRPTSDGDYRGADLIFRSFLVPIFGRYFGGSTAPGLRAQVGKSE